MRLENSYLIFSKVLVLGVKIVINIFIENLLMRVSWVWELWYLVFIILASILELILTILVTQPLARWSIHPGHPGHQPIEDGV